MQGTIRRIARIGAACGAWSPSRIVVNERVHAIEVETFPHWRAA